jgi:Zn-dependent metalloprotease
MKPSDIWGACIEYYAAPGKSTWLIGEDIERRAGSLALRSMSDPKSEGQPDTYGVQTENNRMWSHTSK